MDEQTKIFLQRVEKSEHGIKVLQDEINELKHGATNGNLMTPDVEKLEMENAKLAYQINHLKRCIKVEKDKSVSLSISIQSCLKDVFSLAINQAFPGIVNPPVDLQLSGSGDKFGDYQCNSAMNISQILKTKGEKKPPRDVAQMIINCLPQVDFFDKVEIAGAGFINIYLNKAYICQRITNILTNGIQAPRVPTHDRVVVDFSAPNIAKEMHVGHLRSTIIGESVCRLLEWLGHDVLRINHIGDWGTQFGMLIAHLKERFPNHLNEMPPIADLQAFYKESKERFDNEPEFKKRAYLSVTQLQSKEPSHIQAWQLICNISRIEFEKLYERLGVTLIERGESFYQERMEVLVKHLTDKELLINDDGRKIMFIEGHQVPLIVVKSDGGFTYDTSDLTAIKQRLDEEKGTRLVYVVGGGQSVHLETVFSAARHLGWFDPKRVRVEHIAFGDVLGENKKKFKTREGQSVRLAELLDEGLRRSEAKLKEKGRADVLTPEELKAAKEAVAYGCIKYADLSHNRQHDYVFSFDKMLDDRGNTAAYLLYAYTRIRSIRRNAQISDEKIREASKTTPIVLNHPKEWKLAKCIVRFGDVILKVADDLFMHTLCDYVYELSATFTEFYDSCYCIEKDKAGNIEKVNMERILLCETTANTIKQAFNILGLTPVEKM